MDLGDLNVKDGIAEIEMDSWMHFVNWINSSETIFQDILYRSNYIWRGQSDPSWKLESSLDRKLKDIGRITDKDARNRHLSDFKMSIRGRTEEDISKLEEDELWAIGQHYGLATPLLDWTNSPYIASYFAFEKYIKDKRDNKYSCKRAIFALNKNYIQNEDCKENKIQCVEPFSNYNVRLVNQSGMFIKIPQKVTLEEWVEGEFKGNKEPILIKFSIQDTEPYARDVVLTQLNRMNINALTLFPDLIGSSLFCNMKLEKKYY